MIESMTAPSIPKVLRSIRTKFGLGTACFLLGMLLVFYLGGRFILVHMIREAEKQIQVVGDDIRTIVYGELDDLQLAASKVSVTLSRRKGEVTHEFLQAQLGPFSGSTPVNLVIALGADGAFEKGCFLDPGTPLAFIDTADVQPYLASMLPLLHSPTNSAIMSGVITFRGKPAFIAMTPVKDGEGKRTGFVILGSLLHNHPLLSRINEATQGMQVSLSDRLAPHSDNVTSNALPSAGIAPVFQEAVTFYSGGPWHLGENVFEAVVPVHDILGKEVSSIAIRLPRSFSSLASIALGWLTAFVATVGIIFVLPIFWLQTRVLLSPLSTLTEQIREIGDRHPQDGNCAALDWPQNDEFGMLARSVNNLIESISLKTRQIREIEQRQNALIAGMPDCLCVFDSFAHLVAVHKQPDYANPIPGLIVGRPIAPPLFPESDCESLRKAIAETFRTEKIQVVIVSCREADGSYCHFETRISRMDACLALVILRDVTKEWRERETRAQVEERLTKINKMESLGNLAAGIAHDFNNILSIIQNTVDLNWQKPGQEANEALSTIRQAIGKGAALTRELMTYAGQTRIAFQRDDPNTLVLDLKKLMGGVIAQNVTLELKLTPGLHYVEVDPHQFWKVLINLLKNASEAMNGSRGQICVSTFPFELTAENIETFFSTHDLMPGHGVVFQIEDTGSGMSREVIGRIFEPFFSTKAVGRGLGLSTVFGIVDAHSGGIAIDSELGKGTCFRIWLPAAKAQPLVPLRPAIIRPAPLLAEHAPDTQPAAPDPQAPHPCVLLVEDDPAILRTTTIVLRAMNVDTLQAASKREALMLFRKHADSIRLILLDSQLGHLDNVRLLATLRLRKPGIPVVIVSGHPESRIREMFASEPFDGFLGKPYTRGELASVLTRIAAIPTSAV